MIIINFGIYIKKIICIILMIGLWFLIDWIFQLFYIKDLSIQISLVIILEILLIIRLIFLEIGHKKTMKGYQ